MMLEVVTRTDAATRGLPRYFTAPCVNNHYDGRFVSNGCCVGCHRESIKKMRKKYPEKERIRKKRCNSRRIEKIARYDHEKYIRDKENILVRLSKWRADNPEKVRHSVRKGRALRKGAEGHHTIEDIDRIFLSQRGKCAYFRHCGTSLRAEYHVDHIVPLSRGGSNWSSNLQLTCKKCNSEKGALNPLVFSRRIGMLV